MSFANEFRVVDLIVNSGLETCGVDAFALSVIKAERQVRRLFTHLVYQCPAFNPADVPTLRETLGANGRCYFEGFERGINALYARTVADLVGPQYDMLRPKLVDVIDVRNKIFHGQLTSTYLSKSALLNFVADIRCWCELLGESAAREIGYDGFMRNSFQKGRPNLWMTYWIQITDINAYATFLAQYVERPPRGQVWQAPLPP